MPDWQKIVLDLQSFFGSANHLARRLSYGNPEYLRHLSRGTIEDPRYSVGSMLIEAYQKHIREELPMVGAMQQRALIK